MRAAFGAIVAIFALLATAQTSPAQRPSQTDEGGRVLVSATVKDTRGALVNNLEAGDFRLFEGGVEQKITSFSAGARPLSAAIVIDKGLNLATAQRLRSTFSSLAEAFSPEDEAGVFSFDTIFRTVADFTSDQDKLYRTLKIMDMGGDYGMAGGPLGASGPVINGQAVLGGGPAGAGQGPSPGRTRKDIDDAVLSALEVLAGRGSDRRRIILLVTDGSNSSHNEISTVKLMAALRKSDVEVYSIGLDNARLPRGSGLLTRLAAVSGGELFKAVKQNSIEPLYSRITEQARYQYVLGYTSEKTGDAGFRAIEVRVTKPGVTVIAREGYIP